MEQRAFYTVPEIGKFLRISRTKAYELANSPGFPTYKIGKVLRVPAKEFHEWLSEQKNQVS